MDVPTRAEIPDSDKWDLTHLFGNVDKWKEDFRLGRADISANQGMEGQAWRSRRKIWPSVWNSKSTLDLKIERLYHFASLQLAEDSANTEYLARVGQIQNLLTKIGEAFAFVVPEIQAIDDETFRKVHCRSCADRLADQAAQNSPTEAACAFRAGGADSCARAAALDGYDDTFSQLTDVDMKFGVLTDETGREKPLTQSSFSSFLVKRDPELRKRAFHQFYAEFQDHQYTLASSLAYSVKADVFRARARNYPSALEAALFPDDVPVSVYDGLDQIGSREFRAALSLFRICAAAFWD